MRRPVLLLLASSLASVSLFVAPSIIAAQRPMTRAGVAVRDDFSGFDGTGLSPTPLPGQLDSNAFRVTGVSDAAVDWGGIGDTGDYARGTSGGGVSTGGVYAFLAGGATNPALGVQPTALDFTPGSIVVRYQNATGGTIDEVEIAFTAWYLNDEDRASEFRVDVSTDGALWTPTALVGTTPELRDATPRWVNLPLRTSVTGLTLLTGDLFYVRFATDDGAGALMASRDELAIDDLAVTPRRAGTTCTIAADCDDGNPCTTHACTSGLCVTANRPAGYRCLDGNVCNGDETCDGAGTCLAGAALDCDDGEPCTADSCAPTSGCAHSAIAMCCSSDADCGDGDDCTTDICAVGNVCRNDAIPSCGAIDDAGVPDGGDVTSPDGGMVTSPDGGMVASPDGGVVASPDGGPSTHDASVLPPPRDTPRRGGGCAAGGRGEPAPLSPLAIGALAIGAHAFRRRQRRRAGTRGPRAGV